MLFKIQKSKKDEPQSQFSQLNQQLFTLLYLHSCNHTQQTSNKLLLIVFYLVNLILENSIIPCGFDIRELSYMILRGQVPETNYYLNQRLKR